MDLQKYIPVGEENAVEITILAAGNSLTGLAWLADNTATELSMRTSGGALGANVWVIADTAITALTPPPPSAERGARP